MNHKTKINLDVYESTVTFHLTDDIIGTVNKINKRHGISPSSNVFANTQGCAVGFNYDAHIVINKDYCNYNTVSHEIYHATEQLATGLGIHEEEAKAWICGYLSGHIYSYLAKKKIKLKHG